MIASALAFSGGKDSLACWFICRDEGPFVIWVNTGKAYPETLRIVNLVKGQCLPGQFIEVKTDQENQNIQRGIPSEIIPIDCTEDGMLKTGIVGDIKVQSYLDCCLSNISIPLHTAAKRLKVKYLIRGQRLEDVRKSTARDGTEVDGLIYKQPIENWSKTKVMDFLSERMDIPEHFRLEHSSLDCYDCTAYLSESQDRVQWTKERYPEFHKKFVIRLKQLKSAISPSMQALSNIEV